MFSRVEALRFRALRHVDVKLDTFHVLVGPNGSGKTSFLDIVGFIGDLLRVGPSAAIHGDPRLGVPARATDPAHLCWMRQPGSFELAVEIEIPEERRPSGPTKFTHARYEVAIEVWEPPDPVRIASEALWLLPPSQPAPTIAVQATFPMLRAAPATLIEAKTKTTRTGWKKVVNKTGQSANDYFSAETSGWNAPFRLGPSRSALANLPEDEGKFPVATWVKRLLGEQIQRVVLDAQQMRLPSPPGVGRAFLPDGSNLPWVIDAIRRESAVYDQWIAHVRTALPDLRSVDTVEREEDRHRYLVVEYTNGLRAPAWLVSDGTLRLLALTLLAYAPISGVVLVEEPENGIHPRGIETVYQSLRSVYDAQVLCASHSPIVLSLARPAEVLCFAKDSSGATDAVRGSEHPRLRDWKARTDLGVLFATGVLG